ncbi:dihydrofolate reductase family protein [Mucilaginibacter pedocola]|uniref:Bacterial bifunctional deaminase-reductase C-terminal domain-containing protein n=1 Tax=Mucilaginibacter pedocola TaxID=1792845 RepID=A0A1S9PHY4_9SPHI|nr:dihydrofolate reductase family protein [Mucilaginibacter pedocola]OOQ60565.1 hypothetical protein BC343_25085 [Mucilaginibacter pedocola]
MRKVILNVAVSLDGLIEGPNGEYDWCFVDQDYGMSAFFDEIDAVFIGRKSYELVRTMPEMLAGKKVYVFSDTLVPGENENVEVISSADFEHAVEGILNEAGKNIWLFGGASLLSALLNKNWVTEMLLSIHPIVLGEGKPLFAGIKDRIKLQVTGQQIYDTGLVQIRYTVMPKFDMEMLKML